MIISRQPGFLVYPVNPDGSVDKPLVFTGDGDTDVPSEVERAIDGFPPGSKFLVFEALQATTTVKVTK